LNSSPILLTNDIIESLKAPLF